MASHVHHSASPARAPRVRTRLVSGLCLALWLGASGPAAAQSDDGWISLFDGKSLEGWKAGENPDSFRVEDGVLIVDGPRAHLFYTGPVAGANFTDFEFKADVKTFPGANSGIYFHTEYQETGWPVKGIEAQVNATHGDRVKTGSFYGVRNVMDNAPHKDNEWFNYHISARGKRAVLRVNGEVVNDWTQPDDLEGPRRISSGTFALQAHDPKSVIHYRNIQVKVPEAESRKVVFVAGPRSHGYGMHEHRAGVMLFKRILDETMPHIESVVHTGGWPDDPKAFDGADAIIIYCDGGRRHPVNARLEELGKLMKQGVGLGLIHYGVEVPVGDSGERVLEWIGGHYEDQYSCNPIWSPEFKSFPDHPVTRGVRPFTTEDEWYFNIRFRPDMKDVTSILVANPPDSVREGPYVHPRGPYPHVVANKGQDETMMWAVERADGGRGFGFTGGHFHWNWGHPDQRKVMLNAIVWAAGAEVPTNGVPSPVLTLEDLEANQDSPQPDNFDRERIRSTLEKWQAIPAAR